MSKRPRKWKMAILIWIAIYPTVLFVSILLGRHIQKLQSLPLQTMVSTLIVVPIAVYAVVPALEKLLHSWLSK